MSRVVSVSSFYPLVSPKAFDYITQPKLFQSIAIHPEAYLVSLFCTRILLKSLYPALTSFWPLVLGLPRYSRISFRALPSRYPFHLWQATPFSFVLHCGLLLPPPTFPRPTLHLKNYFPPQRFLAMLFSQVILQIIAPKSSHGFPATSTSLD